MPFPGGTAVPTIRFEIQPCIVIDSLTWLRQQGLRLISYNVLREDEKCVRPDV